MTVIYPPFHACFPWRPEMLEPTSEASEPPVNTYVTPDAWTYRR